MSDNIRKLQELTAGLPADPYAALDYFFGSSPALLCVINSSGMFAKVSASFCNALGFTEEEILASPFVDFIHPDDVEPTLLCWGKTLAGHDTSNFSNRFKCKSGDYKRLVWALPGLQAGVVFCVARVDEAK